MTGTMATQSALPMPSRQPVSRANITNANVRKKKKKHVKKPEKFGKSEINAYLCTEKAA